MNKTIKQSVTFKCEPHEVYEMIMDSKKHSQVTGAKAEISREIGGKVSAYDGYARGENLELIPDEKIVQTWIAADWEEGNVSKICFEFKKVKNGTRLTFTHSGVPESEYDSIKEGWREFYWDPMKAILGGK